MLWPRGYVRSHVFEVRRTEEFHAWLEALRDARAKARVLVRIERLTGGNPGDVDWNLWVARQAPHAIPPLA